MNITKITNEKWINLFSVDWEKDGKTGNYLLASRKQMPVYPITVPDAVIIVPIYAENRKLELFEIETDVFNILDKNGSVGVITPGFRQNEWNYLPKRGIPKFAEAETALEAAHIFLPPENKLGINLEYRIPIDGEEWAFPAGLVSPGESIEDAASRELTEESGLKLTRILKKSPLVYSSAGLTDESSVIIFVECEGEINTDGHEDEEFIKFHLLNLQQVRELVRDQTAKISAKTWPILLMFDALGKLELK